MILTNGTATHFSFPSLSILLKWLPSAYFSSLHSQSFITLGIFSILLLSFFLPFAQSSCQRQLCRLVYCCDKSSAPFICCQRCYRGLEVCALFSHVATDSQLSTFIIPEQIRTGPSNPVLDKRKEAGCEDV